MKKPVCRAIPAWTLALIRAALTNVVLYRMDNVGTNASLVESHKGEWDSGSYDRGRNAGYRAQRDYIMELLEGLQR